MALSTEELLRDRVKCIGNGKNHFPNSPFEAGEILDVAQDGARLVSQKTGNSIDWLKYKNFPHLFKEIMWWHFRNPDELPNYVGVKNEKGEWNWICPVVKWTQVGEYEEGRMIISFTNLQGQYEEMDTSVGNLIIPSDLTAYNKYINNK